MVFFLCSSKLLSGDAVDVAASADLVLALDFALEPAPSVE
jgi:hypothetical protein